MENPTASLFSLPFPSDSSRRTLALLIRGTPLVAAHALGSAAGCAPSAVRCSRAGPVAAQPADGRVLAWPRAARHGLAAAARFAALRTAGSACAGRRPRAPRRPGRRLVRLAGHRLMRGHTRSKRRPVPPHGPSSPDAPLRVLPPAPRAIESRAVPSGGPSVVLALRTNSWPPPR